MAEARRFHTATESVSLCRYCSTSFGERQYALCARMQYDAIHKVVLTAPLRRLSKLGSLNYRYVKAPNATVSDASRS
jgi:hypothetical protein